MKIPSNTFKSYTQGFFVALLQVVIFLTTFFVATTAFAQEISLSEETSISESKELQSIEPTEAEEQISLERELPSQEPELSKEQQAEISELDKLLKSEKISQEEYDKRKQEIIGTELLATEQMSLARSAQQVEPEAQTLGKYIAPTVSTTNGSLNYTYPISLPSGRNNLTPDLSLSYTSGSKSYSSVVATGWSVNIPYIQRFNKTGTEDLYTTDTFTSSIDGELISQGNGIFTPRVETGNFLKYEYSNNSWEVTDKEGTVYEFGLTTGARQDKPNDSSKIFSWMLEKVTDTNGNVIDYTYFKDGGQIYPDTISYAIHDVTFTRTARTSSHTAYNPLFAVTTNHYIDGIEVETDNSLVSDYALTIANSKVEDITLTGHEGTQNLKLPSTLFDYADDNQVVNFNLDTSLGIEEDRHLGVRFADVNGDSLPDFIANYRQTNGTNLQYLKINTGSGWQTASWTFPSDFGMIFYDYDAQKIGYGEVVDVNGDGLADLVYKYPNKRREWKFYINNGSGWTLDTDWGFKDRYGQGSRFGDVNGDGLPDVVTSYVRNGNHTRGLRINTGSGWVSNPWLPPNVWNLFFYDYSSQQVKDAQLTDVNQDGLVDFVLTNDQNDWKFYVNEGQQWTYDSDWDFDYQWSRGTKFGDIDGDGLGDIISAFRDGGVTIREVHKNTGSGWQQDSINLPNVWPEFFYDYNQQEYARGDIVDINGDGITDFVYKKNGDDWKFYKNSASPRANIDKITHSLGGTHEFTYDTARSIDASNTVGFPLRVVTGMTTDDQNGNVNTTSYLYKDAEYYYDDPFDRKFAGFGEVIQTNPDNSITTIKYHQGNGQQGNEPTDSYAKIGKVYETSVADGVGNSYEITRTNYEENNLGGISNSIQTESVVTLQYDGTSSHTDTAVGYDYDNYGNVTKETQYGEVSGNTNGTFTDSGSDKRTTDITYTNNTTDYIVGLPTNQTLKNNSGTKEAETDFSYDTDGNLLTQSQWISGTNYADTTYTYNSYGLPLTETDPLNNTTSYVYDSHTMYPATVTNAEGHVTSYTYDYSSGKMASMTEPNGKVTQYDYDALDRFVEEEQTFENGGLQTMRVMSYNTSAQPQYRKETLYRSSSDSQDIYTYLNGFGKTIQTKQEMDSGWLTLDTVYDSMDRIEEQSLPYETSSSSNSNSTSNSNLLTSFVYDPLGRVTSSTNAKGTTTTDHNGFETTVTDAENNEKDLITDAFKNLVQVNEYNGSSTYTTEYEYNAQNLLTKITDAENNVRDIAYDGIGRRTSLEDLHDASDSTFGTWSFVYDDINLTSQTDPKGTTTSYTYDDINRVLTEDNSSTVGIDITYNYDSCTFGSGKLCSVTTPDVTTSYNYLKQGLVDTVTKLIDGVSYTTNNDYNRQGQATKVIHPNSSYTDYEYNTRGLVDNVLYNGTSLVTADYGVHGRPTSFTHSNGATSTLTYDANELYELTGKTTTSAGIDIQDMSYSYDDVGNITQIVDASATDTAKTQTFTYDDLYRLTQSVVTNSANSADYTRNYTYSPIGNITAFNGVSYSYTDTGYSNPHAVTSVDGTSYTYDNNGNLTSDGTWTHTWDYRNRLSSSTDGLTTSSYEYDHENMRTKLVEGSDTTIYPSADYELLNGNTKISLSLGETLVATDDNGTINHVHTDHLGGTNITTDTLGAITQTLDYFPFGDTRIDTGTDNETKQFTGYTKDASTGLHYAGARYYANDIGRFISQDPASLRFGTDLEELKRFIIDPQKLNTYSYAKNNPVSYIDPDGEEPITLLTALSYTLFAYSVAELGVNAYEINTIRTYPEQFSVEEINSVQNETLFNLATIGVGKTLDTTDAVLFDSGIIAINELGAHIENPDVNFESGLENSLKENDQGFNFTPVETNYNNSFAKPQNQVDPIQETTSFVKETFSNLQSRGQNSGEKKQTNRPNQTRKRSDTE